MTPVGLTGATGPHLQERGVRSLDYEQVYANALRLPTTDGRELLLVRRTEPDHEITLLLRQLGLTLPAQPPPKICQPAPVV